MISFNVFAWRRRFLNRGRCRNEMTNRELLNSAIRRGDLNAARGLLDGRPMAMGCAMDFEGCHTALELAERYGCKEISALVRHRLNLRA